MRKISFEDACKIYSNRFTMDHVPVWAKRPANSGKYYAPQYASDREWYDSTVFPSEPGLHGNCRYCESTRQTWPLGRRLGKPFIKELDI